MYWEPSQRLPYVKKAATPGGGAATFPRAGVAEPGACGTPARSADQRAVATIFVAAFPTADAEMTLPTRLARLDVSGPDAME